VIRSPNPISYQNRARGLPTLGGSPLARAARRVTQRVPGTPIFRAAQQQGALANQFLYVYSRKYENI
jgi:hypothetical protein